MARNNPQNRLSLSPQIVRAYHKISKKKRLFPKTNESTKNITGQIGTMATLKWIIKHKCL